MDIQQARKVKYIMVERGIKQSDVAQQLLVSHVYVHKVIHFEKRSHRVREAIAKTVEITIDQLYPLRGRSHLTLKPPNLKMDYNLLALSFSIKV